MSGRFLRRMPSSTRATSTPAPAPIPAPIPIKSGTLGHDADAGATACDATRSVGSGWPCRPSSVVSRREMAPAASVECCAGGIAASSCWLRRIAAASSLWNVALLCATSAVANAFASCAAPSAEVSSAVTATTSLAPTTCTSSASTRDWRDRFKPSCAEAASTICGAARSAAALPAAVRAPPVSRSTPMPAKVGSDVATGATRICAVAR